jgi:hypothetical protein
VTNLPSIKISVPTHCLTQNLDDTSYTQGYLVAVKSEQNNPLKFTVYLESGSLWSGLTIDQLRCFRFNDNNPSGIYTNTVYSCATLQPYSCLTNGPDIVIEYNFMKNMSGTFKLGNGDKLSGHYLFTIDTHGGSGTLADDPEQYKTFNVIQLENNQLCALPNNFCYWYDEFMFNEEKAKDRSKYKRNNANYTLAGG